MQIISLYVIYVKTNYIRIERFYYFSYKFLQISDKYIFFIFIFSREAGKDLYCSFNLLIFQLYCHIKCMKYQETSYTFLYTKYVIILLYHYSFLVYHILLRDSFNNIKKLESVYIVQKNLYKNVCVIIDHVNTHIHIMYSSWILPIKKFNLSVQISEWMILISYFLYAIFNLLLLCN